MSIEKRVSCIQSVVLIACTALLLANCTTVAQAQVPMDTLCVEGISVQKWGWWGTGVTPGTTIPGTVSVSDPSVAGVSESRDGPFLGTIDILFTQGEDYVAWAPPIYTKGLSKGISIEEYWIDLVNATWITNEWHVVGLDSLTITNLEDQPAPGSGKWIFPGKRSPSDTVNRARISVSATLDPPPPFADTYVVFKSFDVDDSTSANRPGSFLSSSNNVAYVLADAAGVATDEFDVSKYPGDKIRIAAACSGSYMNGVTVVGTELRDDQGNALNPPRADSSDMITVWRDVHIEVDTMATVSNNLAAGYIRGVKNTASKGTADLTVDITYSAAGLQSNQYENGKLVVINDDSSIFSELPIASNVARRNANIVTISTSSPLAVSDYVGKYFQMIDEDDYNRNTDGSADNTESIVPSARLYEHAEGNTSDPTFNPFADAYIRFQYDGGGDLANNQIVPFQANFPFDTTTAENFVNMHRDALGSDDFWVAYVVLGYQGDVSADNDPNKEEPSSLGYTLEYGLSNRAGRGGAPTGGPGSFIFLETIRDYEDEYNIFGDACLQNTLPHELGHQFGIKGDRSGMGIMGTDCSLSGFTDDHIEILRSRVSSPGY